MRKEETPVCVACNTALSIKHILIECADLLEVGNKYFEQKSVYSLFRNVNPEIIFDILRETGVLSNMKRVTVMVVSSIFKELLKRFT